MQFKKLWAPPAALSFPLFFLRLVIGLAFMNYGYMKVTGGTAMWEAVGGAMEIVGISFGKVVWGLIGSWTEFGGGILLILGLAVRPVAAMQCFMMVLATISHLKAGDALYVAAHPFELIGVTLLLVFTGAGKWSVDQFIANKFSRS